MSKYEEDRSPKLADYAASIPATYRYPVAIGSFVLVLLIVGVSVSNMSTTGVSSGESLAGACVCTLIFRPVCTNEGTVPNACEAKCKGLEVKFNGACEDEELPEKCNDCGKDYAPVCGDDRLTYLNTCVAECSGMKVWKAGVCSSTIIVKPRTPRDRQKASA